jgi:uncharacterized protein (UPF0333 family)
MKANKTLAWSRKAQNTLEYAICLSAALLAAVAMVTYVKRGVSGRYRNVVKAAAASAKTNQYEPYYYSSNFTVRSSQNTNLTIRNRGERITDFNGSTDVLGNATYGLSDGGSSDDPITPVTGNAMVTIPTSVYLTPSQLKRLSNAGIQIWGRSNYDPPSRQIEIDGPLTDPQRDVVRIIQAEIDASPPTPVGG